MEDLLTCIVIQTSQFNSSRIESIELLSNVNIFKSVPDFEIIMHGNYKDIILF